MSDAVGAVRTLRMEVIVVCWNDRTKITTALDSVFALPEVRAHPGLVNVVISDNGSTDGSRDFLRARYGERIHIVENGKNLGFAAACNRAFAATSAEYIFLLNPDAELRPGALATMIAFLDAHPRCGIAGSRILNYDGSVQQSVGEFDTWAGAFLRSSAWGEWPIFARFANGASLRDWHYDTQRRVDLAIGAALAIRRRLIAQIGAFDERFFLYHEEVDFAKRAAGAGWETWFVPASEAVHEGQGSAKGQYSVEQRKQRSRRAYWIKHHGFVWFLALNAALIGRYALYLAALCGGLAAGRRLLRR
jgi:N-acetylglucosaminyl-diphospho-decaprenol L-rhamnosyltransferase